MRLLELFSGTKSVSKIFTQHGYETVSLDILHANDPTIHCDILTWDYRSAYHPGHFDVIWSSPPCTQYSTARTTNKRPRDFPAADAIVGKALEIIEYFQPKWYFIENPYTGYLKTRPVIQHLNPPYIFDYCRFGTSYRKRTAIWSNNPHLQNKLCDKTCAGWTGRKHAANAQRGQGKGKPCLSLNTLHAIPPGLCEEICAAC